MHFSFNKTVQERNNQLEFSNINITVFCLVPFLLICKITVIEILHIWYAHLPKVFATERASLVWTPVEIAAENVYALIAANNPAVCVSTYRVIRNGGACLVLKGHMDQ